MRDPRDVLIEEYERALDDGVPEQLAGEVAWQRMLDRFTEVL